MGELTTGSHPVKVNDVSISDNKNKIMFVLRLSKTHGKYANLQLINFMAIPKQEGAVIFNNINVCPFQLMKRYSDLRKRYKSMDGPFFVFRDRTPVC